jgi:chlorite dismutase
MTTQLAPETADGWAILHQYYEIDWTGLRALGLKAKNSVVQNAAKFFAEMESMSEIGQSAFYHVYGHKSDLMFLHYRKSFDDLAAVEIAINQLELNDFLKPATSYFSVAELGLYHATVNTYQDLEAAGVDVSSKEGRALFNEQISAAREGMQERLWMGIPDRKHLCFYPMNKLRNDKNNWYALPLEERAMLMMEHGMIGRKYTGRVSQVISGSIGYDDWEWGVDLHVDDPLVVKQLVYELRFDEGSALYGEFGQFFFSRRMAAEDLHYYFNGTLPEYESKARARA